MNNQTALTMKTLNIRLCYDWEDMDDIYIGCLEVPSNIDTDYVFDVIEEAHEYLCNGGAEDLYGTNGMNPSTLLDYICKKYNWNFMDVFYDIDINLY